MTALLLLATITVSAQYKIVADYSTMTLSDLTGSSFIQTSTAYSYGTWGSDIRFVGFGTQTYTFATTEIDSINGVASSGYTLSRMIDVLDSIVSVVPTTAAAAGTLTGTTLASNVVSSSLTSFGTSPTFTGTVTIPTPFTLGGVSVLPTGTELNYVDGVTSAIQTQINAKQAIVPYGRATIGGLVSYSIPGVVVTATGTVATVINTIYYDMIWVESQITIDQMAINVTIGPVGTGKLHVGIYNADTAWQPSGAPLIDSVITVGDGATGIFTVSASLTLPRGRYLIARNANAVLTCRSWRGFPMNVGIDPSLNASTCIAAGTVASAYDSLPTSTLWTAGSSNGDHPIVLRVSTP